MATVTIGCRLPSGLVIDLGIPNVPTVELAGQRQRHELATIVTLSDHDYGLTVIDESFWEEFLKRVGPNFAPLASGAIFVVKQEKGGAEKEAKAMVKELKEKKTGHEPLVQEEGLIKKVE